MRRLCPMAPLVLIGALVPGAAGAQDTAKYFGDNCAVCHTIGGGDLAGPDLKGSTDRNDRRWLVRFLLNPEAVVNSGDAYATKLVAEWSGIVMPATDGLTPEMAEELVEFIERQSRQGAAPAAAPAMPPFTAADRARGLELFTGRARLTNGGPSCVSCHGLGGFGGTSGGVLGPDLAAVHTRLGGATGSTAWLSRPPTPVMRAVYRKASLTQEEVRSLTALFESTTAATAAPAWTQRYWVLVAGLGGAIVGLAVIGLAWNGRLRSVRRRMLEHGA